jgi:hypothetical protein
MKDFHLFFAILITYFICSYSVVFNHESEEAYMSSSVFREFERIFKEEDAGVAIKYLESNINTVKDQRKKIEITCPGPDPPIINISDIEDTIEDEETPFDPEDESEETAGKGKDQENCLQLVVKGKNFDMNLSLNC